MHSPKNLNIMKLFLSIQDTLPGRIFCMNAVIVACLYVVSN